MTKTARRIGIPSICNSSTVPKTHRSPRQKIAHRLNDGFRLLEMWQVRCLVDEFDPRSGNSLGKLLRISRRDDAVRVAPDDERRRANAMNAVLESSIRDRPDKLAGASKRPVELCQRVDARLRIFGTSKKRRAASPSGSANSARRRTLSLRTIQFLTGWSSRHSPTGSIRMSWPTSSGVTAAISAASNAPNE